MIDSIVLKLLRLPAPLIRILLGGRRKIVDGLELDAGTQLLIELVKRAGIPPLEKQSPKEARSFYSARTAAMAEPPRALDSVINRSIPSRHGPIPVRIYVPKSAPGQLLPALVYYHGGGWVIGSLDTHDRPCRMLAEEGGCVVISVDYRLAPEHRFPAAVDDALDAFEWVAAHASELEIDGARIAVGGDSAGGALATVVARLARDAGGAQPFFQLLIYPVTDLTMTSRSYATFGEGFLLTKKGMEWFRSHYLSSADEQRDPRASPLHASDLAGLPPALVVTAGFDPLKDEGAEYAARLRAAGVQVAELGSDSLIHGFLTLTGGLPRAAVEMKRITEALRAGLRSA